MSRKDILKKKNTSSQRDEVRPLKLLKKKSKIKYRKPEDWLEEEEEGDMENFLSYLKEEEE
jgi:hypothetical protein